MGLALTVLGSKELKKLAEDLRRSKGTLRRELVAAFRTAGQKTLKKVKHNIETNQIVGVSTRSRRKFTAATAPKNLRRRISRVTELELTTSAGDPHVTFRVRADRLGNANRLPEHVDSGKNWRHPIMGNRHAWAANRGQPWFTQEIKQDLDDFRDEADKAIDRTVEQLEKG